jgi:hypothetical protein
MPVLSSAIHFHSWQDEKDELHESIFVMNESWIRLYDPTEAERD